MPSYLSYLNQMSVLDADDDIQWITVRGNHIPIKKGENKEDAIKSFFESKGKESKETAQKSPEKSGNGASGSGNGSKSEKSSGGEKKEFMSKAEFESVRKNVKKILSKASHEEPSITADLKSIKGIKLEGLDYRLKTEKSAVEKVKRERIENPYKEKWSDRKVMRGMYDLVRYTQLVDKETFVEQVEKTLKTLKDKGYKIVQLKNFWRPEVNKGSNPYRGINMKLRNKNGQNIEMQFNTKNNLDVKEKMHQIYNKQRELKPESKEWQDLNSESLKLTKLFDNPKNIEKLVA